MIYSIHHHWYWEKGGIESGQAYRAKILRNIGQNAKFIYATTFPESNIQHETSQMGFLDSEVLWLYGFFSDCRISPITYTLKNLESTFGTDFVLSRNGSEAKYVFPGTNRYVIAHLTDGTSDYVKKAMIIVNGCLLREDYYTHCRVYSEYYAPLNNYAHLYLRRFFNEDGTIAYEEIIDGDMVMYKFPDRMLYSREELVGYMMEKLELTKNDIVLIDGEWGIIEQSAFIKSAFPAKVGMVIHMEHFSEYYSDENHIFWMPCYEYALSHSERLDFFITSTEMQSNLLREQVKKCRGIEPEVITIPVAGLDEIRNNKFMRKKHSLITAGRLEKHKHVDLVIKAVKETRKYIPDLSLDIYGDGIERQRLAELIEKLDCSDYVHLCGYQKLDTVYQKYEAYISGSNWEGFGVTLLEAVGSGLPIIGFDVRYGNQIFIDEGKNGYRVPFGDIQELAERILRLFTEADLEAFRQHSYEKAQGYLTREVEKKWKNALSQII